MSATSSAPSSATKYADTTALFEYNAGTAASRIAARAALTPTDDVVTSDHVEREWKRILFTAIRDILEAAEGESSIGGIFKRLGGGFGREQAQRLLALALLCGPTDDETSVHELRIRAQRFLRGDIERLLNRTVGTVRRTSRCGLATQRPQLDSSGRWHMKTTCKIREGICVHEERIENDLVRWNLGADALVNSDSNSLKKMGKTAREMAANPRVRTGKNTYGHTGDLAIALECKPGEALVTSDHSFDALAPAMSFQVLRIPTSV